MSPLPGSLDSVDGLSKSTLLRCSVAVASTFAFCILRNKIGTNLKIFKEIAEA
jgi:hypothetical protein